MKQKINSINRRTFIGNMTALGTATAFSNEFLWEKSRSPKPLIKPPRLRKGDTIGLITPASGLFEPSSRHEAREVLESLGFQIKFGQNIRQRNGYLAGTDRERVTDLHEMFLDNSVQAILTIRGGYGSGRLLDQIDYDLIQQHPKILMGYSDITALHLALHKMTGLVTFHGPVALSTFNDYSTKYVLQVLTQTEPVGEIKDPPLDPLRKTLGVVPIREGVASGALIGGNLTMITATLGTPFEIETKDKILFLEEVGEEPYAIDRMLTQLRHAGKLHTAAGIVIDRCARCGPRDYKPAFENTLSVEEVYHDRLHDLNCPVMFGLSLGHVAHKPTLPLGIPASMNTSTGRIQINAAAVI